MKIKIEWCLENLRKAYLIHDFKGDFDEFVEVLKIAKQKGIKYTIDISENMINEVILQKKK